MFSPLILRTASLLIPGLTNHPTSGRPQGLSPSVSTFMAANVLHSRAVLGCATGSQYPP